MSQSLLVTWCESESTCTLFLWSRLTTQYVLGYFSGSRSRGPIDACMLPRGRGSLCSAISISPVQGLRRGVPCLGFGASRGRYCAARFFQVVKIISGLELGSGREDDEGKLGREEDAQLLSEVQYSTKLAKIQWWWCCVSTLWIYSTTSVHGWWPRWSRATAVDAALAGAGAGA
ncbi:uncharacterized protein BO66DRAFT_375 [Aspergillus aculeatinus CBS 121060]|uniref:Uncharacterized protein n=1 Tax=Aspergillus aculeatinus CBS 121060 TaxID=1448322 RepID=A0ACD1HNI9_9EURO|nr:hypothetical protein BO66DRAFT_375 [Aspergillus aculeatinus CBS 121060]RAH75131.1 hypothetical protein BO66DRAFT_375 [Aspergillus aculeatinus CBS 121060]